MRATAIRRQKPSLRRNRRRSAMIELSIETSSAGTGFGMAPIDPVK
jgi:hypothetical protein